MTKFKNIVVAAAALVIFTNISFAQAEQASYSVNAEEPLKVNYLGEDEGFLLFKVTLQSNDPSRARFSIDDKNEGQLYASGLTDNLKVTTVKIERGEEGQVLRFRLVSEKKRYIKTFSVNTSLVETTTVAETDISRL